MERFGAAVTGMAAGKPEGNGRRAGGAEQLSRGQPQEDFFIRKAGRQE